MGEELLKKMNNENYRIINELIDLIVEEKIESIEELKNYQDNFFTIDDKKLNHQEQIEYCKKIIYDNPYVKEDMDFIDIQNVRTLKEELKQNKPLEEETKIIIKLMSLMDKDLLLPYDAYNMIMNE